MVDFELDKLQNHINEGKRRRRRKSEEEKRRSQKRKTAMVSPLVFMMTKKTVRPKRFIWR